MQTCRDVPVQASLQAQLRIRRASGVRHSWRELTDWFESSCKTEIPDDDDYDDDGGGD